MNDETQESGEVTWEYYTGPGSVSRRRLKQDGRPKPHVCDVCERAFDRPSALLQHGHTHTGERPHLCPVCKQKRFATTSNLYRHSRTCKGAKSDFIAVSYGERLLGASEYGPPNSHKSDPISEPAQGNIVIRQRFFPTHTRPNELLPSSSNGQSSVGATNIPPVHSKMPSPVITPKVEDDDSPGPWAISACTPAVASGMERASSSPKNRAPPLFAARRPKPSVEMASDASPPAPSYTSEHSSPSINSTTFPPVSNRPMSASPPRSPSYSPPHSRSPQLPPPQLPISLSTSPALPPFSSFASQVPGHFETSAGVSNATTARPPLPTNLKWADEAKKTRRTTPSQQKR